MFDHSDRPFFKFSIIDLESVAKTYWTDMSVLVPMTLELFHRRTDRAIELRIKLLQQMSELIDQGFPWPSTEAEPSASGEAVFIDAPSKGLLGYRVGASGLQTDARLSLLDTVYTDRLPQVNSMEYMSEWGHPQTAERLRKMADSIAAFVRNSKRRNNRPQAAIDDWEADLQYLYTKFYLGRYNFFWPNTD
ncbi:hypothetical protein [Crateriforma conspicua]|uniref:Uncharacterized protein n=1 Tax=Crateriforma conspicua TaxID=2527996 RepID=A0A5C5YAS4_9PLAN|nr:hypothetical protein [Crateriforma conspicua]TWT71501.1 hypothetical protein Pan14r_38110 [Crateriforma conspicua]